MGGVKLEGEAKKKLEGNKLSNEMKMIWQRPKVTQNGNGQKIYTIFKTLY